MATSSHPRRRPQRATSPLQSLRKSETFTSPSKLNTDLVGLDNIRFMPKRSPTCITTLEDYVSQEHFIASRQEMIAKYLQGVDDVVEGRSSDISFLNEQQILAVPHVAVRRQSIPEPMEIDSKKEDANHHHYSDSGIGSSVNTPVTEHRSIASLNSSTGSLSTIHSAINRSFTSESTLPRQSGPEISEGGLREIQDRILNPILNNKELEAFHPLIKSIPEQVDNKYIANLRDLEKTFLYSTPVSLRTYLSACAVAYYHGRDVKRFSLSPDSFEKFWEFSIRCLHATVEYLTERDQRRPSDRPYTNNYFLDLVEQIRRYAQIMARTREKEENGEDLDEMDYTPDETVVIEGGLSTNGRPAELVRKKNGKSIPLAPENAGLEAMSSKRPLSDDEFSDDDDILRSMARRRKSDKAGDVMHVCSTCSKEFKRPCDLTKHEKTHSRPFKCTEPTCRYHSLGWPTEKERDRHVNDKHASTPQMYECKFKPCTYSSKRESNCKQHMEKAHGWTYVRSKSNGRKKAATTSSGSVVQSPPTPFSPFAPTPTSSHVLGTPQSTFAPSPFMAVEHQFNIGDCAGIQASPAQPTLDFTGRRDSTTTAGTYFTNSSGFSPEFNQPIEGVSMDTFDFNSPLLTNTNDFFTSIGIPQHTAQNVSPEFTFDSAVVPDAMLNDQSISPGANVTLYSPNLMDNMYQDEGFVENNILGQDFQLFGDSTSGADNSTNWMDLNPNPFGGQFDMGFDSTVFPQ